MSGRHRHRVQIQRRALTQDAVGQQIETWTEVDDIWANVVPVNGRDFFMASGEHAEITHKIMAYWPITVRAGDRIVFGSRYLKVHTVINVGERNRETTLMVIEDAG